MAGGAGALQGAIEALRAAFLLPQKELRCAAPLRGAHHVGLMHDADRRWSATPAA